MAADCGGGAALPVLSVERCAVCVVATSPTTQHLIERTLLRYHSFDTNPDTLSAHPSTSPRPSTHTLVERRINRAHIHCHRGLAACAASEAGRHRCDPRAARANHRKITYQSLDDSSASDPSGRCASRDGWRWAWVRRRLGDLGGSGRRA